MRCFPCVYALAITTAMICGGAVSAADTSPTASAGKQVHTAQAAVDAARVEINGIRVRCRAELASQPEWKSAVTELRNAHAAFDQAKRKALVGLAKDPEYRKLTDEREQAQSMLAFASDKQNDAQFQKAGDLLFKAGLAIKQREMQVLDNNDKYQEAKSRLDATRTKADELDLQAAQTMKTDPAYAQAIQRLEAAEQQLKSARQQLAQAVQSDQQQREAKARAAEQQQNSGY